MAIAIISVLVSLVLINLDYSYTAFPFIVVELILYACYKGSTSFPLDRSKKGSWAVFVIGITAFVIGFTIFLIAGGYPQAIDTGYYILNHGTIIKEITYLTYRFLQFSDIAVFGGLMLLFSAALRNGVEQL